MEFTEEEVKKKLRELGYVNVPTEKLQEFMTDLQELVENDSSIDQSTYSRNYSGIVESESNSSQNNMSANTTEDTRYDRCGRKIAPLSEVNFSRPRSAFSVEKVSSYNQQQRHRYVSHDKENLTLDSTNVSSSTVLSSPTSNVDTSYKTRRKVARKCGDRVRVFDETLTDSEAAPDITLLEDCIKNLQPFSTQSPPTLSSSVQSQDAPLPAFIRSSKTHPHTKKLRKCDPVSRYHQFKEEWDQTKLPGESKHSSLRWQVRGQMLNYEAFEKPKHRPMVNNYIVPTDKKRQSLRWQVRTAMANT